MARTSTDMPAHAGAGVEAPSPAPKAKNKWFTASLVDAAAIVIAQVLVENDRRDPSHKERGHHG